MQFGSDPTKNDIALLVLGSFHTDVFPSVNFTKTFGFN